MKQHIKDFKNINENSCGCHKCFEKVVRNDSRKFALIKKLFPQFYKKNIELCSNT